MALRCPICKSVTAWEENPNRPFCSEKCRMVDLGKWALGEYKIPAVDLDDESESLGSMDKGNEDHDKQSCN